MDRVEGLKAYVYTNLRKKEHARSRYFLQMMLKVEEGNYHPKRVERYAAKSLKKLEAVPSSVSIDLIESEVVPFEILWGEVMELLG